MTAPSDFLDLHRFEDDGGQPERIEEQWDEPEEGPEDGLCPGCGEPLDVTEKRVCSDCFWGD